MDINVPVTASQSGRGQCIAVLDDSNDLLELMKELLEDEGYKVVLLHASEGAYKKLEALQPALIIVDVVLETPDAGWRLVQILTLNPQTKDIPIIICSAATTFLRAHKDRLHELGYPILNKPFDLDDLLAKVATALASPLSSSTHAAILSPSAV
jgi:CheY-like chemotaxis protein